MEMFGHLLVPLDGSGLAETVLPCIHLLARADNTRVTLVHLIEPNAPATVHGARHLTTVADAESYLAEVAASLQRDGIPTETHVDTNESGDTAGRIVDHAAEMAVDLIVLCSHGRSGIGRWLFGSIAQKVLAVGAAPVFLVFPTAGAEPRHPNLSRLLVPLDGTPEAEVALPLAEQIAKTMQGTLTLLLVVPTTGTLSGTMATIARFSPSVTEELLDGAEQDARAYLQAIVVQVRSRGIAAWARVERGDPVETLIEATKRLSADLIVMASHGRGGWGGVWSGSVGNKLLSRLPGPFLLVRTPGDSQTIV
jgi:nucleotide-binding universal stress UspA family protein